MSGMRHTLVDLFELKGPGSPTSYRSKASTLLDPFEVGPADPLVVTEDTPRGVCHETWRRARCWGADDEAA